MLSHADRSSHSDVMTNSRRSGQGPEGRGAATSASFWTISHAYSSSLPLPTPTHRLMSSTWHPCSLNAGRVLIGAWLVFILVVFGDAWPIHTLQVLAAQNAECAAKVRQLHHCFGPFLTCFCFKLYTTPRSLCDVLKNLWPCGKKGGKEGEC